MPRPPHRLLRPMVLSPSYSGDTDIAPLLQPSVICHAYHCKPRGGVQQCERQERWGGGWKLIHELQDQVCQPAHLVLLGTMCNP